MSLIRLIGNKIAAAIGTPTAALNFQLSINSLSFTPTYVKTFLKRVVTINKYKLGKLYVTDDLIANARANHINENVNLQE